MLTDIFRGRGRGEMFQNLQYAGSHPSWRIAPIRSHGMAPCPNPAPSTLVSRVQGLPIYQILGLCNHITLFFISLLRWQHNAIHLFPLLWQHPVCYTHLRMSGINQHLNDCHAHHLKLNLNTTELLLMPGKYSPHMDLLVIVEDIAVPSSQSGETSVGY